MHFSIKTSEIKKISSEGNYERAASINVKYLDNTDYRFSVAVSKKQGAAAERNRVKRVLREIMRIKKGKYPPGLFLLYYNGKCKDFNRNGVVQDLDDIMRKISTRRTV